MRAPAAATRDAWCRCETRTKTKTWIWYMGTASTSVNSSPSACRAAAIAAITDLPPLSPPAWSAWAALFWAATRRRRGRHGWATAQAPLARRSPSPSSPPASSLSSSRLSTLPLVPLVAPPPRWRCSHSHSHDVALETSRPDWTEVPRDTVWTAVRRRRGGGRSAAGRLAMLAASACLEELARAPPSRGTPQPRMPPGRASSRLASLCRPSVLLLPCRLQAPPPSS